MSINYEEYIAGLVAKGRAAQAVAENFSQEKVDELTAAIAYALTKEDVALKFGEMLVEESGMGIVANKQAKIFSKVKGSYAQMKGEKSVGLVEVERDVGDGADGAEDFFGFHAGVFGAVDEFGEAERRGVFGEGFAFGFHLVGVRPDVAVVAVAVDFVADFAEAFADGFQAGAFAFYEHPHGVAVVLLEGDFGVGLDVNGSAVVEDAVEIVSLEGVVLAVLPRGHDANASFVVGNRIGRLGAKRGEGDCHDCCEF